MGQSKGKQWRADVIKDASLPLLCSPVAHYSPEMLLVLRPQYKMDACSSENSTARLRSIYLTLYLYVPPTFHSFS
jgi:hypothetical protein